MGSEPLRPLRGPSRTGPDREGGGDRRATAVNADDYPAEADARNALGECDADLAYLGIWRIPQYADRMHLFTRGVTAEQYEQGGWTREQP